MLKVACLKNVASLDLYDPLVLNRVASWLLVGCIGDALLTGE